VTASRPSPACCPQPASIRRHVVHRARPPHRATTSLVAGTPLVAGRRPALPVGVSRVQGEGITSPRGGRATLIGWSSGAPVRPAVRLVASGRSRGRVGHWCRVITVGACDPHRAMLRYRPPAIPVRGPRAPGTGNVPAVAGRPGRVEHHACGLATHRRPRCDLLPWRADPYSSSSAGGRWELFHGTAHPVHGTGHPRQVADRGFGSSGVGVPDVPALERRAAGGDTAHSQPAPAVPRPGTHAGAAADPPTQTLLPTRAGAAQPRWNVLCRRQCEASPFPPRRAKPQPHDRPIGGRLGIAST
jgi:hypothetical protein